VSKEADLIASFIARWGAAASGIGDDAAVLECPAGEKIVVSTDSSVENVHFRRANISPADIGYRAAAAALSDLAAMAAKPLGLVFALILPARLRDAANEIADGVGAAVGDSSCPIVGGNISSGEELSITTTVIGSSERILFRSGARPGDSIYVTGSLGGAAAAVAAWAASQEPAPECRERFVHPTPRIPEALWLASRGATSAIDLSDGLSTDAWHVADASNASLVIDVSKIPVTKGATLDDALSGGEDYELLVTAPAMDAAEFERSFGIPLTCIGKVAAGEGATFRKNGAPFTPLSGFDHLSRQ
jgi:thiamine-monophosphate kinase